MGSKVLIIDDDPHLLPMIAAAFTRGGFETLSADDGVAGMRIFNAERPALVVTDIVMAGKEGLATIIELKTKPSPPKVIAISGGGQIAGSAILRWAKHLGADEVLAKPFQMAALVATARQLLAH